MKLSELLNYKEITIQCHDNPDADAIGSAYALYRFFLDRGCDAKIVYSGKNRINKANLKLLVEQLSIPIEYISQPSQYHVQGLLLTVDCQYGAGNTTRLKADEIAVIDHHPKEITDIELYSINPNLGSCSTLVWSMLLEEGYTVNDNIDIGTALYYGLYTDTNQLSEVFNPLDFEMREDIHFNKRLLTRLTNANISLQELEIAGIAMIRYNYNDDYHFAVIKSKPCDPNILGLISDFLTQVAEIDTCVVYNEINDGYKLSVRSCVREVKANELAQFLTDGIGSGGGHDDKAGGFISMRLYENKFPSLHSEAYFNNRMAEYFDTFTILYASDIEINKNQMKRYARKKEPVCAFKMADLMGEGAHIAIRTNYGVIDCTTTKDMCVVLERDGSIHIICEERFDRWMEYCGCEIPGDYLEENNYPPTVKHIDDGKVYPILNFAKMYMPTDNFRINGMMLDTYVKVFPVNEEETYMLGKPGDCLAVSESDPTHIFIEPAATFDARFEVR